MVYETCHPEDTKRGSGQYAVYPSIWPEPMHYLTKTDLAYLLREGWVVPSCEGWWKRGPTALIYKPDDIHPSRRAKSEKQRLHSEG